MDVRLVLISHTNVGKTSLARTLLRQDVGEIVDAAHTTLENQRHLLAEAGDDRLFLWDTPGFGNSARLKRRLAEREAPLGWFLGEVWDRFTDQSLWCAQQAMRAVREDGDLVLYLVNASEDPEFATYIGAELDILAWLGVPALVLLNQLPPQSQRADRERLERAWRTALDREPVRDVLALDAFERCWVDESRLLVRAADVLEGARERGEAAATLRRLLPHWHATQLARLDASLDALADSLGGLAIDREPLSAGQRGRVGRAAALTRLAERLQRRLQRLDADLVAIEGLEGESARRVDSALTATRSHGDRPTPGSGAAGGALLGAGAGAALDLLFAGLSFGIFTALGASLSAAAGWSWCYQAVDGRTLGWSEAFVRDLVMEHVARYLAVIHHGRARGRFDGSALDSWREAARAAVEGEGAAVGRLTSLVDHRRPTTDDARRAARTTLHTLITRTLLDDYPEARWILDRPRPEARREPPAP
ncbi:MAG TPA: GTPase domain-containing protein [Pseudomonadales bacterium]|nr:GTPase domain-containing protein [Pseudomonadales bacterium]